MYSAFSRSNLLRTILFLTVTLLLSQVVSSLDEEASWPVVDCSNLVQGKLDSQADAAIAKALSGRGFFFAANVFGNDEAVLKETYAVSRQAHALPVEIKKQYAGRGYTGLDVNVAELAYEPSKKSNVMAWDFAKQQNSFVMETEYPPGLESAMESLYNRQAQVGKTILASMARGLGLEEDTFTQYTQDELGSLRLLRYPVVDEQVADDLTGVSAHTDFEAFTLMHQDAPGLQVRARNSKLWEDVPLFVEGDTAKDAFLIIVGDVLERMTNGFLQATPHRVLPTRGDKDRYSIIRFNAFAADAVIQPLPDFTNETHPAAYSAVTMAEHMRVTIANLEAGKGAWDSVNDKSTTADFDYQTCTEGVCEQ